MEPTAIGLRLASAVIGPLVKRFFVSDAPGAGLVDKPVRLSGYVSFRGEKRTLTESDVRDLAAALVRQGLRTGERPVPADEHEAVTDAQDLAFEATYLPYVAKKHRKLTIYGIDLSDSPTRWPLDVAYLSLEAVPLRRTPADMTPKTGESISARYNIQQALQLPESQPADQALAHTPRVLLRGEAGSGKTTLIQWLAVTAAQQGSADRSAYLHDRVPFVLPLRTLTRHGERLPAPKDFLAAIGCPLAGSQPAGWEHRVLTAGRGLVLVDGIDEIPEPERDRTRRWLRDLIDAYGGANRWLVTSRPSAVGQDWLAEEGFSELALSSMGPVDIATFIERWHKAARAEAGRTADDAAELDAYEAQLRVAVRTKGDLGRLATNPLMCGLICALHRDRRGYLPHGRKDLYEAALSMLISRRDRERDMAVPDLREEPQLDLLQRLAYWLIKNGRTEMDRSQAEDIIGRALPAVPEAARLGDAPTVFEHFLQRSGLLREPGPGTVDFVHRTFQDFLGARAAVEEGDFGLLTAHAANDQWEDVIRMAVALARPRERVGLFQELLALGDAATDRLVRSRVYLLASACLEHATTLEPSVREAVEQRTATLIPPRSDREARALGDVGPLILDLLPGPEGLGEADAHFTVIAATWITTDAALPLLARYADHPSLLVRSQLMWAWRRYDTARYAEEVIARLDPAGLEYTVTSDEQLRHLERLGVPPAALDTRTSVSVAALHSYLSRHKLTEFLISHHPTTDLGFLAGQTELTSCTVINCDDLVDLSALDGLPIRNLALVTSGFPDLRPVERLPDLGHLSIHSLLSLSWSPETLHPHAPLQRLSVSSTVMSERGLKGLGRFTGLTSVDVSIATLSAEDWLELSGLPALGSLALGTASFTSLPATAVLAEVTDLQLDGEANEDGAQQVIDRLPHSFPALQFLSFTGVLPDERIDVSPLVGMPGLTELHFDMSHDRIHGRGTLPRAVKVVAEEGSRGDR